MEAKNEKPNISESQSLAIRAYSRLVRAFESVSSRLRCPKSRNGLTDSQFAALEALYMQGPLCQRAIGQTILKTGGNVTLVIDNLEKLGLVRRERDSDDRRQIVVSLTEKGAAVIAEVFPRHAKSVESVMQVLTPEEQQQLETLCRKLGGGD